MLGFAARARACVSGYTAVELGIRKRSIRLVILDEEISQISLEKISAMCKAAKIPYVIAGPAGLMGSRIGKSAARIAGITQDLFAKRMLELTETDDKTEVKH